MSTIKVVAPLVVPARELVAEATLLAKELVILEIPEDEAEDITELDKLLAELVAELVAELDISLDWEGITLFYIS